MTSRSGLDRPAASAVDLSGEKVHWDLKGAMSYGDYLHLSELLNCQRPLSGQHDETLFIVIHQASELWIKLCLHEIAGAIRQIRADELGPAFKMMSRVARVQVNLIQSWEILSTMTPFDYSSFRSALGKSSGFQSFVSRVSSRRGHSVSCGADPISSGPRSTFTFALISSPSGG